MALCPYLDRLFNDWYNMEPYAYYYMIAALLGSNYMINMLVVLPTKNLLNFKNVFIKLKTTYLFFNKISFIFSKLLVFLSRETTNNNNLYIFLNVHLKKYISYYC